MDRFADIAYFDPPPIATAGPYTNSGVEGATILKKKRADISDLQVNISGDQAEEHPKRYTDINIEFVVHGKGVKPQDVERSIELSLTKYCSATASINADVKHTYRIVEDAE